MSNYILNVSKDGNSGIPLYTKEFGLQVSTGYNRIVIGGRGPYVEFTTGQLSLQRFHIPKDQLYRLTDRRIFYIEFRSNDSNNVKLYYQLRTVSYADYKIGMFYISPYDLCVSTGVCLAVSKGQPPKENEFFD